MLCGRITQQCDAYGLKPNVCELGLWSGSSASRSKRSCSPGATRADAQLPLARCHQSPQAPADWLRYRRSPFQSGYEAARRRAVELPASAIGPQTPQKRLQALLEAQPKVKGSQQQPKKRPPLPLRP
mmetsp:Transcript_9004/g.15108  ORF Transcript_9004/g.15108 Transcript_9004/m.15108 type:complete len:127 (+) Transcript_9004:574-954(+)